MAASKALPTIYTSQHHSTSRLPDLPPAGLSSVGPPKIPLPRVTPFLFHAAPLGCFIYSSGLLVPCCLVHSLLFKVFDCNCAQRRKITGLSCCFSKSPLPCSSVSASYSSICLFPPLPGPLDAQAPSNSRRRHFVAPLLDRREAGPARLGTQGTVAQTHRGQCEEIAHLTRCVVHGISRPSITRHWLLILFLYALLKSYTIAHYSRWEWTRS